MAPSKEGKNNTHRKAHLQEAALGKRPRDSGEQWNGKPSSCGLDAIVSQISHRSNAPAGRAIPAKCAGSGARASTAGTTFWLSGSNATFFSRLILHVQVFSSSKITGNLGAGTVLCISVSPAAPSNSTKHSMFPIIPRFNGRVERPL